MQKMRRWKKMTTTKNLKKKKKDINEPFFETIFIYKKSCTIHIQESKRLDY